MFGWWPAPKQTPIEARPDSLDIPGAEKAAKTIQKNWHMLDRNLRLEEISANEGFHSTSFPIILSHLEDRKSELLRQLQDAKTPKAKLELNQKLNKNRVSTGANLQLSETLLQNEDRQAYLQLIATRNEKKAKGSTSVVESSIKTLDESSLVHMGSPKSGSAALETKGETAVAGVAGKLALVQSGLSSMTANQRWTAVAAASTLAAVGLGFALTREK